MESIQVKCRKTLFRNDIKKNRKISSIIENMSTPEESLKKRRGRKKKIDDIGAETFTQQPMSNNNITIVIDEPVLNSAAPQSDTVAKKRGRKPKGGKLITKQPENSNAFQPIANIILHLKCSMQDLTEHNAKINQLVTDPMSYNPLVPPNIMTYNIDEHKSFSIYDTESMNLFVEKEKLNTNLDYAYAESQTKYASTTANLCSACNLKFDPLSSVNNQMLKNDVEDSIDDDYDDINIKDVSSKLKKLKLQLYKNSNQDKKSACFWCTYEYDNPSCYIPKYEMDGQLHGYGSFCRPECAVGYLMKENIDDSTKFERYHLLNQMYSKIYNYKKNIKPAPNPYFLLEKFYGNLSIQEYRKLLKTEHMLMVIEKPMTRILPELHEDNDDFVLNIYGGKVASSNNNNARVYKVKRQSEKQKGPSKSDIMKETFGF